MDTHREAEKVPLVIPVVLYHGKGAWPSLRWFSDMVDIPDRLRPEIKAFVPDFTYVLQDLTSCSDEQIREMKATIMAKTALLLLKHVFDEDLGEKLPGLFAVALAHWCTLEGLLI